MPRIARIVVPGVAHHITQRGNRRMDVFFSDGDRAAYLDLLQELSAQHGLHILGYCLMSNHVHLVGIPRKTDSMARTIQIIQVRHTHAINRIKGWHGNLWQQRYFACALDDLHLWLAVRYVEQNPVRAGIVSKAEDYIWSSAAYHCGLRDDAVIEHDKRISAMFDDWYEMVNEIPDDEALELLRMRTHKGIPCGSERFIKKISRKSGRDVTGVAK